MGDCRARPVVFGFVALVLGCASSDIDGGFGASNGVFSTTAQMTDPSVTESATATTSSTSANDTDDPSGTDDPTDTADPSDTDDPSATETSASGPGTDTDVSTTDVDPTMAESSGGADDSPPPVCGDGVVDPGEACDDANGNDADACLTDCSAAACGDGIVYAGVEACDDGVNDGAYGGCNPGCGSLAAYCGDGAVAPQEMCDAAVALPFNNVGCGSCVYDFSAIPQLYCNGTCTWAGADSCDQADADIYCRLVTGDPQSTAMSFQIVAALDAAGFACPSYGTNLGPIAAFGVGEQVWYQDTSILANHGAGLVIANAVCT